MEQIFGKSGLLAQTLPEFEWRPQQLAMSEAVMATLREGGSLLVEAGTGTGKTLAYLVPAILSGKKVVISTGTKNLQEQIFFKDIPLLKEILPHHFSACYMKGRNNYLCLRKFKRVREQLAFDVREGNGPSFQEIERWALKTKTGDRAELASMPDEYPLWLEICSTSESCAGQKCENLSACFIARMKQEAAESDLIIVNHHLLFADLALKDSSPYGEVIPRYSAVILDEAHMIEDIATQYFGISISNYKVDELIRDLMKELATLKANPSSLLKTLDQLSQRANRFFRTFGNGEGKFRLTKEKGATFQEEGFKLVDLLALLKVQIENLDPSSEEIIACIRRAWEMVTNLSFIVEMENPTYVYWYELRGRGVFLQASPIDVSKELREKLFLKSRSVVLTSATLSAGGSFSYTKARLGIDETEELILESPFDYQSQALLYLPKSMPDPRSPHFAEAAASEIEKILKKTEGRAFVLFTSYRMMNQVYSLLKNRLSFPLFKQGDTPKSYLLTEFRETPHAVLFATSSFWQGVDVQGEALSCVIIDKLPFASPEDPITEARIEYIEKEEGNPFFDYQVPSAIIALKQGLGRLIRNRKDRGIFSILDSRILSKSYGKLFLESLPDCPISQKLDDIERILPPPA
ncbi:MAG: DEAD/DEAH box helicase [Candidatus Tectomicrobia bacterium]|nr:DEAD/DEAH box helicase [Candidatus Tectomicrobia bacterium]